MLEEQGSLAQNSMRWAAFEDENDEANVRTGLGFQGEKLKEWQRQWEECCDWIIAGFV